MPTCRGKCDDGPIAVRARGPRSLRSVSLQARRCRALRFRAGRRSRGGYIRAEAFALRGKPRGGLRRCFRVRRVNDKLRLSVLASPLVGPSRSDGDRHPSTVCDDESGIAVAHVPFRALERVRLRSFLQSRILGEQAWCIRIIFGPSTLRAPAAPVHATLDRQIECSAVHTGHPPMPRKQGGVVQVRRRPLLVRKERPRVMRESSGGRLSFGRAVTSRTGSW
jgi:hypothetical protein